MIGLRIAACVLTTAALAAAAGCDSEKDAAALGRLVFEEPRASSSPGNKYACATCHAATAGEVGDRMLPGAVLAGAHERPSYWQGQELDLLGAINHCRNLFMNDPEPWTGQEENARALYAYLLSLPAPVKEAVPFSVVGAIADLPAGPVEAGATVYRRACASCHGEAHTASGRLTPIAPLLPEQTVAAHADYTPLNRRLVFVEKVRHGVFLGYAGWMPPFSREVMSDTELAALLAFLGLYQ